MWSKRKLAASTFALLRSRPRLHPDLNSFSRVFTPCFIPSRDPSLSPKLHRHGLLLKSRVLYSTELDVGGAGGGGGGEGGGESRCWSCGAAAAATHGPFLSCSSCRCVQPLDSSIDYFKIFGMERRYGILVDNLEGKYKDWQKKLHPDLVHSKSEKEKAFAAEQSARVIDAYRTLSKPLPRALYLLQLEGIHVDEEKTVTDPELLMEMMDIRETVDEANDSQTLKQIQSQIQKKFTASSNSFQEAFEKPDFDHAINAIQRMRYYDRAIEEIVKKL